MSHRAVLALGMAAETQNLSFWVLAVVSVAAALGMVLARRAVHCAVLLAVVMLSLAVLYAQLGAPFLAFVQIIVYTGAVLMLFLFVLMIVGVSSRDSLVETIRGQRLAAAVVAIGIAVLLALIIGNAAIGPAAPSSSAYSASNLPGIATLIFTTYVFPFEVTSALLITAALGAMVLAHRERTKPKPTQRELARLRVSSGRPAPLPGPGTYAQHNAVDMPALLPDGTPSELSVSPVILQRELAAGEVPAGQRGREIGRRLEQAPPADGEPPPDRDSVSPRPTGDDPASKSAGGASSARDNADQHEGARW
jgi:NADH-quinone oxidoreductase subunit J